MADVNAPFVCRCGSTLFVRLKQFNATNCELETDPVTAPMVIECADCKRRYQQTPEWGWAFVSNTWLTVLHEGPQMGNVDEG